MVDNFSGNSVAAIFLMPWNNASSQGYQIAMRNKSDLKVLYN